MKIVIDRKACTGHARCHAVAPEHYPLDDDGYIATDGFSVTSTDARSATRGARACPERAITVVTDDSSVK